MTNTAEKQQSTELVIIQDLVPENIFKQGGADTILEEIENQVKSIVVDISTEAGRKEVASIAHKIARSKTALDAEGKVLKDKYRVITDQIDGERRKVRDRLDVLKEEFRAPLTEFENKEKQRLADHEDAILKIVKSPEFDISDPSAEDIQSRVEMIGTLFDGREWEEFKARATMSYKVAKSKLIEMREVRKKRDQEKAELERLRRDEEDRKRKEEIEAAKKQAAIEATKAAEEKAAKEKEESEKQSKELAAKAEAEKQAAIEAERAKIEKEKKAEADAIAKREADKAHRKKINNEALEDIIKVGCISDAEERARAIVTAIAKGNIRNVKILY